MTNDNEEILTKIDKMAESVPTIAKLRKNYERMLISWNDLTMGVLNQMLNPANNFSVEEVLEFDKMVP